MTRSPTVIWQTAAELSPLMLVLRYFYLTDIMAIFSAKSNQFEVKEYFMTGAVNQSQEFKDGMPRFTHSNGVPIEFEIKLVQRGDIPAGCVIRAYVDDSQKYQAEGTCWRALTSCPTVNVKQRIEKNDVVGWKEINV